MFEKHLSLSGLIVSLSSVKEFTFNFKFEGFISKYKQCLWFFSFEENINVKIWLKVLLNLKEEKKWWAELIYRAMLLYSLLLMIFIL